MNDIKAAQFPWMLAVTKNAPQQAIKNLGAAFKRFFAGDGNYPRFKKKGVHDSFRADNGADKNHPDALEVQGQRVKLPVIGWVKMRESLRFSGKVKGSANWHKAKEKIARLHARIGNIRADALHKLTTELVGRFTVIGIEDLNVRGMMANDRLSRSIADMGFHEFRRQLAYKAAMYGSRVVVAGRWHPSLKTCSDCGAVLEDLPLSIREWECPDCGAHHDRDVNAAKNLMKIAVSSTVKACGEEGSGLGLAAKVKPTSVKQESNIEATYA